MIELKVLQAVTTAFAVQMDETVIHFGSTVEDNC